ncbi:PTS glucose transporter subunit IIA [Cellulomonas sp. HZM]|uniref:PTS sugar transporter subunit IIA n=1 Tax=Cellulomonas sp. HZM TaxID=1454010 RepID=UPI00049326B8|nr:PTS glucose transporter subunit IIA [Cellulomonas sp. HZM]
MSALTVLSPAAGLVVALGEVPDPVFSAELVGPGVAIDPSGAEHAQVVAPVEGTVVKMHPHAFVVETADNRGVLVHLGIDTVQLGGEGFTLHVTEGARVRAGQVVVTWDPAAVVAGGRSAVCPVVALDAGGAALTLLARAGDEVAAGEPLLEWA